MTYKITPNYNNMSHTIEICDWCFDNFGPSFNDERNIYGKWFCSFNDVLNTRELSFYFDNVEDATLFKLRWIC